MKKTYRCILWIFVLHNVSVMATWLIMSDSLKSQFCKILATKKSLNGLYPSFAVECAYRFTPLYECTFYLRFWDENCFSVVSSFFRFASLADRRRLLLQSHLNYASFQSDFSTKTASRYALFILLTARSIQPSEF